MEEDTSTCLPPVKSVILFSYLLFCIGRNLLFLCGLYGKVCSGVSDRSELLFMAARAGSLLRISLVL